jgi:uncharacterized protein involved in response to NO
VLFEAAVEFATTYRGLGALPSGALAIAAAIEIVAGICLVVLAVLWALVRNLRVRLLAMLHAGFTWLGVALLLAGLSHAMAAATHGAASLGLAPLHAYTVGFLGSTLFAMVTRVTCGHGGRAVVADDFVWRLIGLLQLIVLARLAAAWPFGLSARVIAMLMLGAAVGWAALCTCWALRYGRWFGTPRVDGRAG